nr:MAG: hypothetical protein [Bacteriophage sp.]
MMIDVVELELKLIEIVMTNITETDRDITRDDRDDRDDRDITEGYERDITEGYERDKWKV